MAVPTYTIVCTKKQLVAPGVYELRFHKPEGLTFRAGQFVLFDVPLVANPADTQPRAYSIASTPDEQELLFCIKLLPGGRSSSWVEHVVTVGTSVTIKGPFGVFVLNTEKTSKEYVFICTGAGVAPFRAQIKHALEAGERRRMDLIFGARTKADLFWVQEFEALSKQYPNFGFHTSLTSGEPDWHGHRGRVQVMAPEVIGDRGANTCVYICGAPDMVKDVKTHCIEQWGIPKADVHAEGYI
jgi:ferredoxin-NADP reductase